MAIFYVDETGFTGEDLMTQEQPYFVQASTAISAEEAGEIVNAIFSGMQADELKHRNLSRRPAGQERVVEFIKWAADNPKRIAVWVAHKEYAMATFIVEWWIEPLAHEHGLNLYRDGANQAMANMLYLCLQGFWDERFRRRVLFAFQAMFRSRTRERYKECERLISKARASVWLDEGRSAVLGYLWVSFAALGYNHVLGVPPRVLDLALPGLVRLGHHWREQSEGPWEVVHDSSSNMAKQKWIWENLSGVDLAPAQFAHPQGVAIFPMNVITTRFVDSKAERQVQLCDILAGATASALRLPENDDYRKKLIDAGILDLAIGGIWPTDAITPEELGRKGWDGNEALNYITEAIAVRK